MKFEIINPIESLTSSKKVIALEKKVDMIEKEKIEKDSGWIYESKEYLNRMLPRIIENMPYFLLYEMMSN